MKIGSYYRSRLTAESNGLLAESFLVGAAHALAIQLLFNQSPSFLAAWGVGSLFSSGMFISLKPSAFVGHQFLYLIRVHGMAAVILSLAEASLISRGLVAKK